MMPAIIYGVIAIVSIVLTFKLFDPHRIAWGWLAFLAALSLGVSLNKALIEGHGMVFVTVLVAAALTIVLCTFNFIEHDQSK